MGTDTPMDAAAVVECGDEVVIDTAPPRSVLSSLASRSDLVDVNVYAYGFPYADRTGLAALATTDGIDLTVSLVPPALRDLLAEGVVSYLPQTIYAAARTPFRSPDRRRIALLGAAGHEDDRLRLSCLTTFGRYLVDAADISAVEMNAGLAPSPSRTIAASRINCVTGADYPPPVLRSSSVTNVTQNVACNVQSLLPATPTLQLGVGTIPKAVGEVLAGDGPFDVWTGLVSEAARALDEHGALGRVTGGVAIGETPDFYDWLTDRDDIDLLSPLRVHSPAALEDLESLVAVNSALQVDLRGQVNAETVSGTPLGGVGGQPAFMQAASADPDGLAVIGMPSRTPDGTPRVLPSLDRNPVTTPRHAVDAVVTEHGVADLRGMTASERPETLVAIAHPDDRPALWDAID